jgi:proline utilization trans-activator
MRIAIEQGMHTDMESTFLDQRLVERSRETWWTVYILDRLMSSLLGVPLTLADEDVTARLPSFAGSIKRSSALTAQIRICRATAAIQQSKTSRGRWLCWVLICGAEIYRRGGHGSEQFVRRVKEAIKILAQANAERKKAPVLDLQRSGQGISRLSAYLDIFHHQVRIFLCVSCLSNTAT